MAYAPVKEEVLSYAPRIMLLHDVISDEDIEWLKGMARPKVILTRPA